MTLVLHLFTIVAIATLTTAQITKSKLAKKYDPDDIQIQPSLLTILQSPDSYSLPALPENLELPREEPAAIPFYTPSSAPAALLQPPSLTYFPNPSADYNLPYPAPSQDLQVPSAEPWNPENDPKFYYELPQVVTKQELPTGLHPKKYNKDIYEKQKPLSSKPKQEINLVSISEQDYFNKQKNVNKVLLNLAKVMNKKQIEAEKVETIKYDVTEKSATPKSDDGKEPHASASGFAHGFDTHGVQEAVSAHSGFNHGLNAELSGDLHAPVGLHSSASADLHSASAGLHSPPPAPGSRLEFQMHGHDGPHSYKWGFDTGKGHNRQIRYEERDKHGIVKGHYGYYDKHGKFQMVHYDAHPHDGFHAKGSN